MSLSKLQKYILLQCGSSRNHKLPRQEFNKLYNGLKKKPKAEDIQNSITKSLERLINRELMVGYGVRTPHKWYIKEVRLMPKGIKLARKLLGEQQKLPFRKNKNKV